MSCPSKLTEPKKGVVGASDLESFGQKDLFVQTASEMRVGDIL